MTKRGNNFPWFPGHAPPDVTQCAFCTTCNESSFSFWHQLKSPDPLSLRLSNSFPSLCWCVELFYSETLNFFSLQDIMKFLAQSCFSKPFWVKPLLLGITNKNHFSWLNIILNLLQCAADGDDGDDLVIQILMKILINTGPPRHSTCYWLSVVDFERGSIFIFKTFVHPLTPQLEKNTLGDGAKSLTKRSRFIISTSLPSLT